MAPALEYRALAGFLGQRYQVLVIEEFGYGLSDAASSERTVEQITEELHQVIGQFGHETYSLMVHSIGGIYALYYADRYPEEVRHVIGIDPAVPKQNDVFDFQRINVLGAHLTRGMRACGLLSWTVRDPKKFMPPVKGMQWTFEEVESYRRLSLEKSANDTVLDEMRHIRRNSKVTHDMTFSVPVLCFLASQSAKQLKNWEGLHQEIMKEQQFSKILFLEGSHFLHYAYPQEIAAETMAWLEIQGV